MTNPFDKFDPQDQAGGNAFDKFDGDAEPKARGITGMARDMAAWGLKGAIGLVEAPVGVADIVTGGRVGKALENEGGAFGFRPKQAREAANDWHSEATKDAQRKFQEADGIGGKLQAAIQNPSNIVGAVAESLPSMAGGAVAARGLLGATRLGQAGAKATAAAEAAGLSAQASRAAGAAASQRAATIAGAAGEGTMMAGSQAEAIRQETPDGLLTPGQAGIAALTGGIGGLIGGASGRFANKLGVGDADTMLAQGAKGLSKQNADEAAAAAANPLVQQAAKSVPRQVIEGAITEGLLEELPQSVAEQLLQNLALDKPWSEGLDDAIVLGVLSGGAMGAGAAGFRGITRPGEAAPGAAPSAGPAPAPIPPGAGPDWTTEAGAAGPGAPAAAPIQPTDGNGIPYENTRIVPEWDTQPGVATAPLAGSIDMPEQAREFDTGDLELQQPAPVKPSEAMGLNPNAGALSAAAVQAVDSGASDALQAAAAQAQTAEQAARAPVPTKAQAEGIDLADIADPYERAYYESFFADAEDAQIGPEVKTWLQDDTNIPDLDAASNASDEDFLRALGANDQEITDAIASIASQPSRPQEDAQSLAGAQANEPADTRQGAGEAARTQGGQVDAGARGEADADISGVDRPGLDDAGRGAADTGAGMPETGGQPGAIARAPDAGNAQAAAVGGSGAVNDALSNGAAPKNLKEGLAAIRAKRAEEQAAQAGVNPQAEPGISQAEPGISQVEPGISHQVEPGISQVEPGISQIEPGPQVVDGAASPYYAPVGDIRAVVAKQIPDMTDAEIGAAIDHYGPDHARTGKLQKEQARRAAPAPKPAPVNPSVKARIEAARQARADHFAPGNIVKSYSGHDRVVSYNPPPKEGGNWSVTVQAVVKQGDAWVDAPNESQRTHSTQPGERELKVGPVEKAQAKAADAKDPASLVQAAKDNGKLEIVTVGDKKPAPEQKGIALAGWAPETGDQGNTIWTKTANSELYTATLDPAASTMEVTVLVGVVDSQIASFKVESSEQAARMASEAVARDVAETKAEKKKPAPAQEAAGRHEHAGLKIYPIKVKVGGEVVAKWAVQTLGNAEREKNGERQLGGDPIADTLDGAKALAEGEIEGWKRLEEYRADMAALDEKKKESDAIAKSKKDANKGKSIVERARDARLDSTTNIHPSFGLGTGSKRESMQMAVAQDRLIEVAMVRDEAAKKRDKALIVSGRNLPTGNVNYPGVKEYFEAAGRLKANDYEKPEYRVFNGRDSSGSFYRISKTEYDYAQGLIAGDLAMAKLQATATPAAAKKPLTKDQASLNAEIDERVKEAIKDQEALGILVDRANAKIKENAAARAAAMEQSQQEVAGQDAKGTYEREPIVAAPGTRIVKTESRLEIDPDGGKIAMRERPTQVAPTKIAPAKAQADPAKAPIQTDEALTPEGGEATESEGQEGAEDVRFSRSTKPGPTFSPAARMQAVQAVEKTANAIRNAWANGPQVVVAFDMQDPVVPESARRADLKQRSGGARGAPEGFYYRGKVYLIASKLNTVNDAARVLFHEALGHHGLRGAFGKSLDGVLNQVATMRRAQVDAKIKEYGLRGVNALDRRAAAEEVLAELAQSRPEIGFVKRAVAAIRTWLRENVPGFSDLNLSDDEIVRSFILPARNWVERRQSAKLGDAGPAAVQRGGDRALWDAKKLTDILEGAAFREKGLRGLEIPQQRVVLSIVARAIHNRKVFDGVVQLVPVDVMNNLTGQEGSSNGLLDDPAMFQNLAIINSDNSVPKVVDEASALVRATAFVAAKQLGRSGQRGFPAGFIPTMEAFKTQLAASMSADAGIAAKGKATLANMIGLAGKRFSATGAGKIQDRHVVTPTSDGVLGAGDVGASSVPPILSGTGENTSFFSRGSDAVRPGDVYRSENGWAITVMRTFPGGNAEVRMQGKGLRLSTFKTGELKAMQKIGRADYLDGAYSTPQSLIDLAKNESTAPDSGGAAFSRATDQTQTEAFKKWFAGSKVVDAEGKPLRVFHGTKADIQQFQLQDGTPDHGQGFFFTSSSSVASNYAGTNADGANTQAVESAMAKLDEQGMKGLYQAMKNRRVTMDWYGYDEAESLDENRLLMQENVSGLDPDEDGDHTALLTAAQFLGLPAYRTSPNAAVMPVFLAMKNPLEINAGGAEFHDETQADWIRQAKKEGKDGVIVRSYVDGGGFSGGDFRGWGRHDVYIAFRPEQIKSATGNLGTYDPENPDIRFSRASASGVAARMGEAIKSVSMQSIKNQARYKKSDWLGLGLQALGRRQIVDIYGKDLPQLSSYNKLAAQMEADKNEVGAEADQLAQRWGKVKDEKALAELMHDATLAQIDPDKPYEDGDDKAKFTILSKRYKALTDEARQVYRDARAGYENHHAKVREAIKQRIMRSELTGGRRADLLNRMDDEFFKKTKGVYFPLARFGQYVVAVRGPDGKIASVNRAETMAEAQALRASLIQAFPPSSGHEVIRPTLSKEFIASRDAVGRGFMTELYGALDGVDMGAAERAELEDTLGQLYLSSLPDLSWAKHGIHRKGTPGFSQDARRAFAQNMFHGGRYLAKLRYSDLMQTEITDMQKMADDWKEAEDFDQPTAQRVVDEMQKRHESLMNPKSNPLSSALTSLGFVFFLGLSPASALVNLSQTALVAYPVMAAKWGFDKSATALLKASKQTAAGKNDITGSLTAEERAAYDEAVRAGTIDVTMAHDLAGIAQGEDSGVMWKIRPVMRWASFMFHHAERFNRQVTFIAAYRLAKDAGADAKAAFEQATEATYQGHFDYSSGNRPRVMQGNTAKVLLLFKQYGQNMVYTLGRSAQQAIQGETPAARREARRALSGLLVMHGLGAGALGLPLVTTLLAVASMIGGGEDEPWDAKVALQNTMADLFGQKPAEVMMHGLSRLTPWDISGRVGLDRLILPDVQEGLEGQRLAESAMTAALGPVAGIGVNILKGVQDMGNGQFGRGLEGMLPSAVRNGVKAIRYANDGAKDKSGIVIKDEVNPAEVIGQALGFSPSSVRNASEGKSAVLNLDRELGRRRSHLLTEFANARRDGNADAVKEAQQAIAKFNEKNPGRRITIPQMMASVRARQRRIDQAKDGLYLPKSRADARDAGRFAAEQ